MKKIYSLIVALIVALGVNVHAVDESATTVLADLDFSVFTDGSEASPKTLYSSDVRAKLSDVNYASSVAAAGGSLYLKAGAYVDLNNFPSLPSSGATLRVTAEVKMKTAGDGVVQFSRGSSDPVYIEVEGGDWTTVTGFVTGFNNSSYTRLRITNFLTIDGFYLKSLKVEYNPGFMVAPEAYLPNDADGTSFTAACSRVSGATTYTASVYTEGADGNPEYVVVDQTMTALSVYSDPSTKITGLDPDKQYYYTVTCSSATATSDPSDPVKVVRCISSIAAPEAAAATAVTATGFTASWSAVENAQSYIVNTSRKDVLTEAGSIDFFVEDFAGVTKGTPSSLEYSGYINDYTIVTGWAEDLSSKTFCSGMYVIYPASGSGWVTLPELDLSESSGKFTLTINAGVGSYGSYYETNNTITAELLNADNEVIETAPVATCSIKGFGDYKFEFTKGAPKTRVRITYKQETTVGNDGEEKTANTYKLYIEEIKLSREVPAGTAVLKQIDSKTTEETTLNIELALEDGVEYSYNVVAVGETVVGSGSSAKIGEIQSTPSNTVVFKTSTSGVDNVVENSAPKAWKVAEGTIAVNGTKVTVHDLTGRTLYMQSRNHDNETLTLNLKGIIIVTVDGDAYKFAL